MGESGSGVDPGLVKESSDEDNLLTERNKITIDYAPLYNESVIEPEFVTDEPPYGYAERPPTPTGFVVYGRITLPPIYGDKYDVVKIEPEHSHKVIQAIHQAEHLVHPALVYFSCIPRTDKEFPHSTVLASQIKTLEVILK